jgi:hypothetical protein
MKRYPLFLVLIGLFIAVPLSADAGFRYVDNDDPTCNGNSPCYTTIQAGINAASDSDVVTVADGTYTGAGNKNIDFGGRAITVRSENGPENCIVDGEGVGMGFYFHSYEGAFSILEGFTIKNFNESGITLYPSSATIKNCIITENIRSIGTAAGGIFCRHCAPTVINCTITHNVAPGNGGGILLGAHCYATIVNSIFAFNGAGLGGGIYASNNTNLAKIVNCTIVGNASTLGGGIISGNSTPSVTNSSVWTNSPDQIYGNAIAGGGTVTYCDVQGGWPGEGNIDSDPLFVDPIVNYHLTGTSPCINTGNNDAANLPATDKDGLPRIVDGTVDIGAYEFSSGPLFPDISGCINFQGSPIVDAEVRLNQKPEKVTTLTDINGCFEFSSLPGDGKFDIKVKVPPELLE